jgi:hypothetical protein
MSSQSADEPERVDAADLIDAFQYDDPALTPAEKETHFRFARDEDVVHFFAAEAGIGRRLVAHPDSVVEEVVVEDGGARPACDPEALGEDEAVVAVRGVLPVGALSVKSSLRSSDRHAQIVSERVLDEVDK